MTTLSRPPPTSTKLICTGSLCLQHHFIMLLLPCFYSICLIGWVRYSGLGYICHWQRKKYKKARKETKRGRKVRDKGARESVSLYVKWRIIIINCIHIASLIQKYKHKMQLSVIHIKSHGRDWWLMIDTQLTIYKKLSSLIFLFLITLNVDHSYISGKCHTIIVFWEMVRSLVQQKLRCNFHELHDTLSR